MSLQGHLASGSTTVARCYEVRRRDGETFGFTDHDRDLDFESVLFRADTGLAAKALQQATGLAVDNSEALGGLSSEAITEADILAGRYDGAEVTAWLVNWADVSERRLQFRGTLGEITRAARTQVNHFKFLADGKRARFAKIKDATHAQKNEIGAHSYMMPAREPMQTELRHPRTREIIFHYAEQEVLKAVLDIEGGAA